MNVLIPMLLLVPWQQESDTTQLLRQTRLTMAEAAAAALRDAKSGVVVQAELEHEKGHTVWSIDVAQGTKIREVLLDAATGEVIDRGDEAEDQSHVVAAARTSLADAVARALRRHPGTAVLARMYMHDDDPVVAVDVFAGRAKTRFVVPVGSEDDEGDQRVEDAADDEADEADEADEHGEDEGMTAAAGRRGDAAFTASFGEDDADLGPTGRNRFCVLEPGYTLEFAGREHGVAVRIVVTVTERTRTFGTVEAREVEEREFKDGQLAEVTRDYFAISRRTNSVYYFGEDVDEYADGRVTGHAGAWMHGQNGAHYGLMLPGTPLLGARFQQEHAPGVAMDRAEITALGETFTCDAGTFDGVLVVDETTPLESGHEQKRYAPGIGLVQDGACRLVRHGRIAPK